MSTLLKDLIRIPEKIHKGDFVLSLAEGVEKPEQTLDDYVVTSQLQECFADALNFVKSALESKSSKMTYLHGSFGSGKSHFMAVLDLILANHKAVRAKKDLQDVCAAHLWTEHHKLLMVPYHMIGAESMEQAILGQYARFVARTHPKAPAPAVYLAQGLFDNASNLRQKIGDAKFFEILNGEASDDSDDGFGDYDVGWDASSYKQAVEAPSGDQERARLVSDLVTHVFTEFAHVSSGRAEAFLPLDQGLSVISHHAKALGYDGIILFLDELILWLASRAADIKFVHQEGQKLAKLVEAQEANRPVPLVSFVARQRDLRELIGENVTGVEELNFDDAFRHWGGRFHTITLEDVNLPDIVAGRVLRPVDESAADRINEAFETSARVRQDVMDVLLTSHGNREMFRKVYPFSPALVETLVAASALLQRNRTAIKALMELLVEQREELTLGEVIPVGDLFDIVSHGDEVFTQGLREHFNNAKRLYQDRFRPLLEAEHHISEVDALSLPQDTPEDRIKAGKRYRNDSRLVKTLLLSALVPRVESFQSLTPHRLAALNHGTITTPLKGTEGTIVLGKLRKWAAQIGELRLSDGDNPTINLQLVGIDTERILEYSKHMDNTGNRKKKIRELVLEATGIQSQDLLNTHTILWRGTQRDFPIEFTNVREKTQDALRHAGDGWRLLIDFPFDEQDFGPKDDLANLERFKSSKESSKTLVWLPQFLSAKVQTELGRLIMLDHVLSGDNFKEATRHLTPQDTPQAQSLLENQRSALRNRLLRDLEMAYGVRTAEQDVINTAISLEPSEQFQALTGEFKPRPPVAANLKAALEDLLAQALAHDFPGHPVFTVESRITPGHLQSIWNELSRLPEDGAERLEIDKGLRHRFRDIAQPLKLGQMGETHFVTSRHWLDEFDRKMHLHKKDEPTVSDLDSWMDDPPTGLPKALRDLIVMSFAYRTNRSFELHGVAYTPTLGGIPREARLVLQPLPSQTHWNAARDLAKRVLELDASPLLNADTISRFAAQAREKARANYAAVRDLPGALAEQLATLRLDPNDSRRLRAAREARELLKVIGENDKDKALVEGLAELQLACTPQEIAASVRSASRNLQALRESRLDVFDLLSRHDTEQARSIRQTLESAFVEHEFVTPLSNTLSERIDQAWKVVKGADPPPPDKPTKKADVPPADRKSKVVSEHSFAGLTASEAETKLKSLQAQLKSGVRVDLTWKVWEG